MPIDPLYVKKSNRKSGTKSRLRMFPPYFYFWLWRNGLFSAFLEIMSYISTEQGGNTILLREVKETDNRRQRDISVPEKTPFGVTTRADPESSAQCLHSLLLPEKNNHPKISPRPCGPQH